MLGKCNGRESYERGQKIEKKTVKKEKQKKPGRKKRQEKRYD